MKLFIRSITLLFLLGLNLTHAFSQVPAFMGCNIGLSPHSNFNSPTDTTNSFFIIDTNQLTNIWQIGKSSKPSLGLYSSLMTDTANTYAIQNTSSFKFGVVTCDGIGRDINSYWFTSIRLSYSIDTDFHNDGVVLETSSNSRNNWRNILSDTNIYISSLWDSSMYRITDTIRSIGKPGFSGKKFIQELDLDLNPPNRNDLDTTWFRFTFYSDSIDTHKAGFALHFMALHPVFEGINNTTASEIKITPNPTSGIIRINNLKPFDSTTIEVYSIEGRLIGRYPLIENEEINLSSLDPGIYLLRAGNKQQRIIKI